MFYIKLQGHLHEQKYNLIAINHVLPLENTNENTQKQ